MAQNNANCYMILTKVDTMETLQFQNPKVSLLTYVSHTCVRNTRFTHMVAMWAKRKRLW